MTCTCFPRVDCRVVVARGGVTSRGMNACLVARKKKKKKKKKHHDDVRGHLVSAEVETSKEHGAFLGTIDGPS